MAPNIDDFDGCQKEYWNISIMDLLHHFNTKPGMGLTSIESNPIVG
jgi:hypothetical protein